MSATGRAYLEITEAVETLTHYMKIGLISDKTISELCAEFEIDENAIGNMNTWRS